MLGDTERLCKREISRLQTAMAALVGQAAACNGGTGGNGDESKQCVRLLRKLVAEESGALPVDEVQQVVLKQCVRMGLVREDEAAGTVHLVVP